MRHCTAVPCLGISNQVYSTFTTAKETIVGVGCVLLAARSWMVYVLLLQKMTVSIRLLQSMS